MRITATRFHDFSAGHRVVGHEGKCRGLHGHNYRIHFTVAPILSQKIERELKGGGLDGVGRVLDFSVINERLCQWLEKYWDHRTLLWLDDPLVEVLSRLDPYVDDAQDWATFTYVPFNPTAENMALHLLRVVGPAQLAGTKTQLIRVVVEETRKCRAAAEL